MLDSETSSRQSSGPYLNQRNKNENALCNQGVDKPKVESQISNDC